MFVLSELKTDNGAYKGRCLASTHDKEDDAMNVEKYYNWVEREEHTLKEAAAILHVSTAYLRREHESEMLELYKRGRRTLVTDTELRRYAARRIMEGIMEMELGIF